MGNLLKFAEISSRGSRGRLKLRGFGYPKTFSETIYRAPNASTVYAIALYLSIYMPVCLSQVGVLLIWLNVRLRKQHCTIAQEV